jgi:flagellar basal body rod protein FlgG
MDPLTITAAGGMRARLESLDLIANNIANASSSGFKADREAYGLYQGESEEEAGALQNSVPWVRRQWTDFRQGELVPTGKPLDLALEGSGFFVVDAPGGPLLTRGGSLQLDRQGRLATREGYALQTVGGGAIQGNPNLPVEISRDGRVTQQQALLGQIKVVSVADAPSLAKQGTGYFTGFSPSGLAAATAEVHQGRLEASNQNPAEAAVRLVSVLRQFETLQRAMQLGNEMNRRAVEEVAKPS